MKILLAEDDYILADGLKTALSRAGYRVDAVANGNDADYALSLAQYDLLILDLGLPGKDGIQVLRNVRERKQQLPVLILTALDNLADRVHGLDLGADDYMTKPFDLPELEARVRALIRRVQSGGLSQELTLGDIRLDIVGQRLFVQGNPIALSAKEFHLLEVFLRNVGRVISKEQLIEHLYGWEEDVSPNALEVAIHRLRKKLGAYGFNLQTIRGLGYLLEKGK